MVLNFVDGCGVIANIMSNMAFIPQIIKSFRRKRLHDVSIMMFVTLFITQLCWIIYAIPVHATQLWISSTIELVLFIPIFIMWRLYR